MSGRYAAAFFADRLERFGDSPAFITDAGSVITYLELAQKSDAFASTLGSERKLLIVETSNRPEPIIAYLGALRGRHPVLLAESGATQNDSRIANAFLPHSIFRQSEGKWGLEILNADRPADFHPELSVLLSTSGSTGSPKLVRLSRENIGSNAEAISDYLDITPGQRAITSLPLHYSYGMSVIHSHLAVGATLLLTNESIVSPKFWEFFARYSANSFAAVPHTFELLERIDFRQKNLPSLNCITQAGGRLAPNTATIYGEWAHERNVRLYLMYGQTEAAPRMSFLPPESLLTHSDSIGQPIPGGDFRLIDENGEELRSSNQTGELVYRGPNVMLGYASNVGDLRKGRELTELRTGDLASRTEEGLYRIVGRKSRFSKLLGLRISLDEIEAFLARQGITATVAGDDAKIAICVSRSNSRESIEEPVLNQFLIARSNLVVLNRDEPPLLPNGKIDYGALLCEAETELDRRNDPVIVASIDSNDSPTLRSALRWILGVPHVCDSDSFAELGGDSLSYVDASLAIESYLGYLPNGWENLAIRDLEGLKPRNGSSPSLDADVVLRALAIFGVLAGHVLKRRFPVQGGADLLLLLAGYSFARFHRERLYARALRPIFVSYTSKIFLPYYVVMLAFSWARGHFDIAQLLFVSTIYAHSDPIGIFWFMEILLYSLVLIGTLFFVPGLRAWIKSSPFESGFAILILSLFMKQFVNVPNLSGFDPSFTFPKLFVFFALGWCLYFTSTQIEKLSITGLTIVLAYSMHALPPDLNTRAWWLLLGTLLMVWTKHVRIPAILRAPLASVAAASFYIYLMQTIPLHYLARDVPVWEGLPLVLITSYALGFGTFWTVRTLNSIIAQSSSKSAWRLNTSE